MKRKLLTLALVPVLFWLVACDKTNNEGEQYIQPTSKEWIPFSGMETVWFTDGTGDSISFTGTGIEQFFKEVVIDCEAGFFGNAKCTAYNMERYNIAFISGDTSLFMRYQLEKNGSEGGFYDVLTVDMSRGLERILFSKVLQADDPAFFVVDNFFQSDSLVIGGKLFRDVFYMEQPFSPTRLYYTKGKGVVGFVLDNKTYVLQ